MSKYIVVHTESRGKIVLATVDLLPGDTVVVEKEPIMYISKEFAKTYEPVVPPDLILAVAGFSTFTKEMTTSRKLKFMNLFGPTSGSQFERIRDITASTMFNPTDDDEAELRPLNSEEIDQFTKIANIIRVNVFGLPSGYGVFDDITRFAHSCSPNCIYMTSGKQITVRTLQRVRAGDELTFSYFSERDLKPTHERRLKYLEAKEFTCHCPRCDALGDDTRQFDCCDPKCNGVMLACQPISNVPFRVPDLAYTGVEYVEPHLLPCTVCHRTAPASYQAEMFELEETLPAFADHVVNTYSTLASDFRSSEQEYQQLHDEINKRQLPRHHAATLPILKTLVDLNRFRVLRHCTPGQVQNIRRAAYNLIEAHESLFSFSHPNTYDALFHLCCACIIQAPMFRVVVFPPLEAKKLLQKTICMWMIMHGREDRVQNLDDALQTTLAALPPGSPSLLVCAFCGDSPLRAALTLSRCGRCRQVAYCSVGCQKAHWKLHKKECKAVKAAAVTA